MLVNDHLVNAEQAERYCYKGGKLDVVIGKKTFSSNPITGSVLVWSDCIAEKDANGELLYEDKKVLYGAGLIIASVPKCLPSKAFHVTVNL